MRKVIIAFDGRHFSEGACGFAKILNKQEPLLVTGVFLTSADYARAWTMADAGIGSIAYPLAIDPEERKMADENIFLFKDYCQRNGLEFHIHDDSRGFAMAELLKETRFADLLLVSSELFYANTDEDQPNEYLKEILHESECPVLLVPETGDFPDNIVLAYDGSAASVYAIKEFAHLFPGMTELPALLFYAGKEHEFPNRENMVELASRHFTSLKVEQEGFDPALHLDTWLLGRKNTLVVSGAYGRSWFRYIFHRSFISKLINEHEAILFIAHK